MKEFDIAIIGGGHAGIEAAFIASQFSELNIAIITLPKVGLASAPCNPAIGGVGKGQVVRELDALGGIIGKLADKAGIQYRVLNDSKGYAVQSTRVQIDKDLYSKVAEEEINSIKNISIIREKVNGLEQYDEDYIISTDSSQLKSKKIIITVGTFLNGKMHIGEELTDGGRYNTQASNSLSLFFKNIKTTSDRFKTGTPARLNKNTINYEKLEEQPSDYNVRNFHSLHDFNLRHIQQVSCYLTRTNEKTMNIIRENKENSPMYNGQIQGVGARYCPSIEDKANRYPDKNSHHVFIEPEGLNIDTVYPSGISSSLPRDVQEDFVKTIPGLESAKIEVYGYAVEYDVIDTTFLNYSLEHKDYPSLHFAGQVNGTSGYEEAAAQGYVAGLNAALSLLGRDSFKINRSDAYIGVLIEDLISNTRDEPYRLFTARNENRLYVREDNATVRMAPYRAQLNLDLPIDKYNQIYVNNYKYLLEELENHYLHVSDGFLDAINLKIPRRLSMADILKIASINPIKVLEEFLSYQCINVPRETISCVAISIKYSGYIKKAKDQYSKLEKINNMKIDLNKVMDSENISFECKQRIKKIHPQTFSQLKLIKGIRPATLAAIASGSY